MSKGVLLRLLHNRYLDDTYRILVWYWCDTRKSIRQVSRKVEKLATLEACRVRGCIVTHAAAMTMEPQGRSIVLAEDADPAEVRSRIECLVKLFLESLMAEKDVAIRPLSLVCRTERNTGADAGGIHLMDATYEKDFTMKNSGKGFFRVWKVMEICYHMLGIGKQATQREMFYKILSSSGSYVTGQNQVDRAIQDVVAVLLCTRRSLGILASSKGLVVGRLVIEEHGGDTIDCSNLGSSAHPISADINMKQRFSSDARYILVIEKDAIFQRLVEERFFLKVPCIIITAKGFPDLASRALLHRLHQEFPNLPIFALVDWNPAGLAIISTFKFGSIKMGLEAPRYVCDVKWLGLRNQDALTYVPDNAFTSLTDRDVTQARSLLASKMLQNHEQYKQEILDMLAFGRKAEIEALYAHGYAFLAKFITQKIVQRDYI